MTLLTETVSVTNAPIMVVDDSDDDYEMTERALLSGSGVANKIVRAEDGQIALDYLMKNGRFSQSKEVPFPALILLDLNLPGKNGHHVLKTIKQTDTIKHIPVVMFSTSDDLQDIERSYLYGCNSYVQKPVDLEEFTALIQLLRDYWLNANLQFFQRR